MCILCSIGIKVIAFSVSSRQLLLLKGSSIWDALSQICVRCLRARPVNWDQGKMLGLDNFVKMSAFSWVNEEG